MSERNSWDTCIGGKQGWMGGWMGHLHRGQACPLPLGSIPFHTVLPAPSPWQCTTLHSHSFVPPPPLAPYAGVPSTPHTPRWTPCLPGGQEQVPGAQHSSGTPHSPTHLASRPCRPAPAGAGVEGLAFLGGGQGLAAAGCSLLRNQGLWPAAAAGSGLALQQKAGR